MARKPVNNLFLIGLILLLGIQLTGLSCLNEWQSLPPLASPTLSNQHPTEAGDFDERADDGCPCHLAFMSFLSAAPAVCCPISLSNMGTPATWGNGDPVLPFHPPLSL
ncbi:MAG: hypothetical protein ACREIH_10755 [Nitrospiraceae bacterium]